MANSISRMVRLAIVVVAASGCALAQYGGGGGMGGGTAAGGGTYNPQSHSYGHGALIGGIVGGAAGGTALLLVLRHHRHAAMAVVGCVGTDGKTLTADKGKKTYELAGTPVTAGEHVSLLGKRTKGGTSDELEVLSVKQDMGQCQAQGAVTAAQR